MSLHAQLSLNDPSWSILLAVLAGWYLALSLLSFLVFAHDKRAARKHHRRVPERRLHLLELLGGFPGAFLAVGLLRHKSSKPSFLIISTLCAALNLAALALLLLSTDRVVAFTP